jgi:hypothetical protein
MQLQGAQKASRPSFSCLGSLVEPQLAQSGCLQIPDSSSDIDQFLYAANKRPDSVR